MIRNFMSWNKGDTLHSKWRIIETTALKVAGGDHPDPKLKSQFESGLNMQDLLALVQAVDRLYLRCGPSCMTCPAFLPADMGRYVHWLRAMVIAGGDFIVLYRLTILRNKTFQSKLAATKDS